MVNPYLKCSAAYSFGMLLYYILHVFYFKRDDPSWLGEAYMIIFALPAIVALKYLPLSIKEHTFRHFLRTSFYIFTLFNFICLLTRYDYVIIKRWVSAFLMIALPLAFVALYLKLKYSKMKDL